MENDLINDLIVRLKTYQTDEEIKLINDAISFAINVHRNQYRKSGEPYYYHLIEVAKILTEIKLDNSSIASGLLHDSIEDTNTSLDEIKDKFGNEIANLVNGSTKIKYTALSDR